jgi:ubiquitin C-terminal hydrolase
MCGAPSSMLSFLSHVPPGSTSYGCFVLMNAHIRTTETKLPLFSLSQASNVTVETHRMRQEKSLLLTPIVPFTFNLTLNWLIYRREATPYSLDTTSFLHDRNLSDLRILIMAAPAPTPQSTVLKTLLGNVDEILKHVRVLAQDRKRTPSSSPAPSSPGSPKGSKGSPGSSSGSTGRTVKSGRITKRAAHKTKFSSRGLPNIGNTCYRNAVLQCLIHTPEFTDFIDQNSDPKDSSCGPGVCALCALVEFFDDYRLLKRKPPAAPTTAYKKLMKNLRNLISPGHSFYLPFINNEQCDPAEFLTWLLPELKHAIPITDTVDKSVVRTATQDVTSPEGGVPVNSDDAEETTPLTPLSVEDVLGIEHTNEWQCSDCNETYSNVRPEAEPYGMIVDIQQPQKELSNMLSYLRANFYRVQRHIHCDSETCRAEQKKKRIDRKKKDGPLRTIRTFITGAPPVLVLKINRTTMSKTGAEKLEDFVNYEEYLNLGEFTQSKDPLFYKLNGVVSHQGLLDSGHYIAAVRKTDGHNFCTIDDSSIAQEVVGEANVLELTVGHDDFHSFLLFYSRVDT